MEPSSGLYLDQINITKKELESYVEGVTVKEFTEDKIIFAAKKVASDINNKFVPSLKASSVVDSGRVGHYQDNMQLNAAQNGVSKGVNIRLCRETSHLNLNITRISLFTDFSGVVTVKVWDLIQNKEIDSIPITCVANEITSLFVNKGYSSTNKRMNIAFIYDASGVGNYTSYISPGGCSSCINKGSWYAYNSFFDARGITILNASNKVEENIISSTNTAGMSLEYSVTCNYEEWLCSIAGIVAMPILYKTAAEIMGYAINSKRFNDRAQNERDLMKERRDEYELNYRENMDNILKNIVKPNDAVCFSCIDRIRSVVTLP